jgi:uncharacterized protein YgbK (DUF1537 family)
VRRIFEVGIQADDLTGACDAGAPFAARGLQTIVLLREAPVPVPPPAVVAIDTDSRGAHPAEARARARAAVVRLIAAGAPGLLFKKLDSTLRGHLSAEIAGALEGTGLGATLLTPAFPSQRRSVLDGELRIDGLPAGDTAIGRDPAFPGTGSSVAAIFGTSGPHPVGVVPLHTVRRGADAVAARLARGAARTYVADAETDEDLAVLCAAADPSVLLAGSGGLARAIAVRLGRPASGPGRPLRRPFLVVAGSAHPTTRVQLERLVARGVRRITPEDAVRGQAPAPGDLVLAVPPGDPAARRSADAAAAELGIAARRIVDARTAGGGDRDAAPTLVLTGGATALAVCRALGAAGIALAGEPLPGVACGTLLDGPVAGLPVVTKAGGFGDPDTLVRLWESAA